MKYWGYNFMNTIEGKTVSEWFDAGYTAKSPEEKIIAYSKVIQLKPDYAMAYYNRGTIYNYKEQYDNSIADFNKAIQFKPDYALAYHNCGFAYYKKGQYDTAIVDFNKAIQFKPDYALAYLNRGFAYYNNKEQYDNAIADFCKAIELKPDYVLAYNNRGFAYSKNGEYDNAIADFNKAIELKPDYAAAYYSRGLVYDLNGQYDKAISDYTKVIQFTPDDAYAYSRRGIAYGNINKLREQIADFEKILSFGVDSSGRTKTGKLKIVYESCIEEARPKAEEQVMSEVSIKAEIDEKQPMFEAEQKAKAEAEARTKAQERKKSLTDGYNAAKAVKRFDRSVLRYFHSYNNRNTLCQIPEWAERIASGTGTFDDRWIKELKIGKNVTVIENGAFADCPNLKRVDFSEAVALKSIERDAFAGCYKLKGVGIPKNCKATQRAFPPKCKIEKIDVKADIQPMCSNAAHSAPKVSIVSSAMRENTSFNSLNKSIASGADIPAIGGKTHYAKTSMVTAPLRGTTIKGRYRDSIL